MHRLIRIGRAGLAAASSVLGPVTVAIDFIWAANLNPIGTTVLVY